MVHYTTITIGATIVVAAAVALILLISNPKVVVGALVFAIAIGLTMMAVGVIGLLRRRRLKSAAPVYLGGYKRLSKADRREIANLEEIIAREQRMLGGYANPEVVRRKALEEWERLHFGPLANEKTENRTGTCHPE